MNLDYDPSGTPFGPYIPATLGMTSKEAAVHHVHVYLVNRIADAIYQTMLKARYDHQAFVQLKDKDDSFNARLIDACEGKINDLKARKLDEVARKVRALEIQDVHKRKPHAELKLALEILSKDELYNAAESVISEIYPANKKDIVCNLFKQYAEPYLRTDLHKP